MGVTKPDRGEFADEAADAATHPSKAYNDGDHILENLGYTPQLQRTRSTLQVAFMAFVLASIPYGLATTFNPPVTTGGPVNIIWGWVVVSAMIICVAASLGEITSVYPIAGGRSLLPSTFPS